MALEILESCKYVPTLLILIKRACAYTDLKYTLVFLDRESEDQSSTLDGHGFNPRLISSTS